MGSSVWQFMWCIDKITQIDSKGEGRVLGGKPIKLSEISGASERTNSRNLNKLESLGYLKLIHAPYGISIRVMKAKKVFQKSQNRVDKSGVPLSERSDISGVPLTKFGVPNKIIQYDKTIKGFSKENPLSKKNMKNSFKYSENQHTDTFEDSVDYDTGELKTPKKKVSKNKQALKIVDIFNAMAFEKIKIRPVKDAKGYFIVLSAMKNLTQEQIIDLMEDWFTLGKEKQDAIQITQCLSNNNINRFKARKNI